MLTVAGTLCSRCPVLLPSFGTDSKPPGTDATQTKYASVKYLTNTPDEEQSAGADGTSIVPASSPRNGKVEDGPPGLDTAADVLQMLSRRASWQPADDRNYFVEHSNKIAYFKHSRALFRYKCYCNQHADICSGCGFSITETFVERLRNGVKQTWHPESSSTYETWHITLADTFEIKKFGTTLKDADNHVLDATTLGRHQESAMATISRIWTTVFTLGEKAGNVISDTSLCLSDGKYKEGIQSAALLLSIFGLLFEAVDAARDRQPNVSRTGKSP